MGLDGSAEKMAKTINRYYPEFEDQVYLRQWNKMGIGAGFEKGVYAVILNERNIDVRMRDPESRKIVPVFEVSATFGSPKYVSSLIEIMNNVETVVGNVVLS